MNNERTSKREPVCMMNEIYPPCRKKRDVLPGTDEPEQICPYFIRDRGQGIIYCECANFHFPDKLARREYVYTFCGHPTGYKKCPVKRAMDHFYERKYAYQQSCAEYGRGMRE